MEIANMRKPHDVRFHEKIGAELIPTFLERGCREFMGNRNHKGYGRFQCDKKLWYAHRFAWYLAYGEIPKGLLVLHLCNNPACCELSHLELGNHKRNGKYYYECEPAERKEVRKRLLTEKAVRGEKASNAKLTEAQAIEIRHRLAAGETHNSIAKDYEIGATQVCLIGSGKRWSHLGPKVRVSPKNQGANRGLTCKS